MIASVSSFANGSSIASAVVPPARELARRAHLHYSCDDGQGIHRVKKGRGFAYLDSAGRVVRDARELARIAALGIPPAWTDVWICTDNRGHLQATGRDARGRKQYVYHEAWSARSNSTKFEKLRLFGEALPHLRQQVSRHLALPKLTRKKVIAAVIALLDRTLVRVGNEEYARANGSYGLTTLRDRHARIQGPVLRLQFQAKSGKLRNIEFRDRRIARIVRQCQDLPGQQLFQYSDDAGVLRRLESADVNRYLPAVTGRAFTAKDFRTWKASALLLEALCEVSEVPSSPTEARRIVARALRQTAEALGNTVTVCRKYYVHPQIIELFLAGELDQACGGALRRAGGGLDAYEKLLLRLLNRLEHQRSRKPARAG
jgi:DNA topoisomerase-1